MGTAVILTDSTSRPLGFQPLHHIILPLHTLDKELAGVVVALAPVETDVMATDVTVVLGVIVSAPHVFFKEDQAANSWRLWRRVIASKPCNGIFWLTKNGLQLKQ